MSDSGITAVTMAAYQNTQIMSIEDDDFPSEDEKVLGCNVHLDKENRVFRL